MRIAIIGSGISGLTVAHLLARRHVETVVFERSPHLGGRANIDQDGEHCPRIFLDDYHRFFQLLREIPALTEDHLGHAWCRVRGTGAPGDIDIVWTAHGVLHLATIADATSSGPILLLSRRQVAIDDLFAEESGWSRRRASGPRQHTPVAPQPDDNHSPTGGRWNT